MKRYRTVLVLIVTLLLTVTLGRIGAKNSWWNSADAAATQNQPVMTKTVPYRELNASYHEPWEDLQAGVLGYGPSFAPSEEVFRLISVQPGSEPPSTDLYGIVRPALWPGWASAGDGNGLGGSGGGGGGGSHSAKLIKSLTEDGSNCERRCNIGPSESDGLGQPAPVPLPGSAWLFLNALFAIAFFTKRACRTRGTA
jgi:hypothetical protein